MRPTIFAPGAFIYQNKGDEVLVLSLIRSLRARWPSADIRVSSLFPELDAGRYGVPVGPEPFRALRDRSDRGSARLAVAAAWLFVFVSWLSVRVPAIERALPASWRWVLRQAKQADLAVAVPGGYLMAPEPDDFWWLSHFCALWACVAVGCPTVLSPCSIGPFAPRYRRLARLLLRRVDLIVLRERRSLPLILDLGVNPERLEAATDMVFALPPRSDTVRETRKSPRIGIAVRRWGFPGHSDAAARWERYVRSMARVADWAVTNLGAEVVLVAQATGTGGDDADVAREVLGIAEHPERMRVIDEDLALHELWTVYGGLDLLIGTRMHANLLALTAGTPVLAIAYERKTWGIMEDLGLEQHVVDIAEVTPTTVVQLAEATWADRDEVRSRILRRLPRMRRRATAWLEHVPTRVE